MRTHGFNTMWALGVMVMMFIAGTAVGIAFGNSSDGSAHGGLPPGMWNGLVENLQLTDEQANEVQTIIDRRSDLTNQRMNEALEYLRAQTDSADREIRAILDPNQQVRLDSIIQERRSQVRMRSPQ